MRPVEDVEEFRLDIQENLGEDSLEARYIVSCYEACIPKSFWDVSSEKVTQNLGPFNKIVRKYCAKRKKVQRRGYGLLFTGDNGSGKTMFTSVVLTQMIKRGCSVYYTTLAQLDIDIKRSFGDAAVGRRLDSFLASDFLAIDELGKEHFKTDSYLNTRLELLLKTRYDDNDPTLVATNLDYATLCKVYGPSISSMWDGKYAKVFLESGDFRKSEQIRMKHEIGL